MHTSAPQWHVTSAPESPLLTLAVQCEVWAQTVSPCDQCSDLCHFSVSWLVLCPHRVWMTHTHTRLYLTVFTFASEVFLFFFLHIWLECCLISSYQKKKRNPKMGRNGAGSWGLRVNQVCADLWRQSLAWEGEDWPVGWCMRQKKRRRKWKGRNRDGR